MTAKLIDRESGSAERSLAKKLKLLADGGELELTATEAAVYGADYADQYPEDDPGKEHPHE